MNTNKQTFSSNSQDENLKLPPFSLEAEQSVIGGMILDSSHFDEVSAILNSSDFYSEAHRILFDAIASLSRSGRPYDGISVIDYLESTRQIEQVGGKAFIVNLLRNVPGSANLLYYARVVRDKAILRQLIAAGNEIIETAYFPDGRDVRGVLDLAETKIMAIAEHGNNKERDYRDISDLLGSAVERIEELFQNDSPITGLETHYKDLDELTSGLQSGDLIIVAGRPSMGKTTFSMNIAENVATLGEGNVAVFSLEMPGEQLAMRMISSVGRIPSHRIRTGKLHEDDWPKLNRAIALLSKASIVIDDTPALTITDLRARARRIDKDMRERHIERLMKSGMTKEEAQQKAEGLNLIVIDYLQLMRGSTPTDNRVNEISEISRGLKALAKELGIPVIALSQLNRSLEQRPDKRPKMSDLRESGAIEQDADLIMFIYRDEVYNPDTEAKGLAEVIIGKHRNGAIGKVLLTFIGEYTRFENYLPPNRIEQTGF